MAGLGPKPRMNVGPAGGGVQAPGGMPAFYDGPTGTMGQPQSFGAPSQGPPQPVSSPFPAAAAYPNAVPVSSPFPIAAQGNIGSRQPQVQSQNSGSWGASTGATSAFSFEDDPDNEPPLLEELGINVEHIIERMKGVAFFKKVEAEVLEDLDLSGPLAIILALGTCLLLAGKITFSYVYGFGVSGTVLLWALINLMSQKGGIDMYRTASVLGYGLIPMVIMAVLGIAVSLQTTFGTVVAALCIFWSTATASRFFATANAMQQQRWLVAYPVCLFYTVFSLLTIF
eukprot:CAMPEP_0177213894 /NCGR_PEP_ID=MMETSP0367-20130122/33405_1 /TAXON_ID=447022 ORGANISM="Scrippsiella hangoei-like, Strain SHHI-4" /NCGR_SAMPLE_ID=MMETSP0367 /ASSEMBLY_ACC=CAM_ASM_000362 /LENGTH=283 /DNA_ID=CAMNT_0018663249 /DNA_START=56 /DNA_END=907 /DNA_ORIENTATION=-